MGPPSAGGRLRRGGGVYTDGMSGPTLAIILLLATLVATLVVGLLQANHAYREVLRTRKPRGGDGPPRTTHA